ncbi:YiiX family permuted papain-like enzyme [Cytophagaceae bacterium DM2B3-1]|uniref:YiiX family permuted papain-like enzyme n=1 Tax=Xanthocytophaga flava TaxID=3048013 RepID=A0ABT7CCN5_9BACT|nr:YiiX family permuted papain-like enzyme [Xanthocytophaga flavus]MDJ1469976.1 YiiX family permuted papain-like enzyme [Xanthocytophaga flavus]MDJ1491460.1 YiiX family permuted papain-like enzyme [Xanthocytophaga flavus]
MRKLVASIGLYGLIMLCSVSKAHEVITPLLLAKLREGDLIFQTSLSEQSKAIQLATKSTYSHCGIIYKEGGNYYVFEAIQPVKITPLTQWILRGKDSHYVVKRLRNVDSVLTENTLQRMKQVSEQFKGKDYDLAFGWSDDKIYCSELIWKIYKRGAGIELGRLQKLRDFDLTNDIVKTMLKTRYGHKIPLAETVVSPQSIFSSSQLVTIQEVE